MPADSPATASPSLKLATWNVNGIRAREMQVHELIARERPDVVCLQEIKAAPDQVPLTLCALEGYWCYWHGQKGYSGVALHVSKALSPERPAFVHPAFDHESRIVTARLAHPAAGAPITVASVYVPNGGKDYEAKLRFLEALVGFAGEVRAAGSSLVICGDLNVAHTDRDVHTKERKPGIVGQRPEERVLFDRLLAHDLVDVARALSPEDDGIFTWWAPWRNLRQRNIGWRIDYVLATSALAARARSCPSYREVGTSDHAPLVATFEAADVSAA